jgi:hypothetical protein
MSIKHVDKNTKLAIIQSIVREQVAMLTPLTISKTISTAIQYVFDFCPLFISLTIHLHLFDKVFKLVHCEGCLADVK